jgi:hypothetical protein
MDREKEHIQLLGSELYVAITEGSIRKIAVRDATRPNDMLRCQLRGSTKYFLARVNSIELGVATIAITFVSPQ